MYSSQCLGALQNGLMLFWCVPTSYNQNDFFAVSVLHTGRPSIGESQSSGIASLSTFSLNSSDHCLLSGMLYGHVFCVSFSLSETRGQGEWCLPLLLCSTVTPGPHLLSPCMCQTQLASYINIVVGAIACLGGR